MLNNYLDVIAFIIYNEMGKNSDIDLFDPFTIQFQFLISENKSVVGIIPFYDNKDNESYNEIYCKLRFKNIDFFKLPNFDFIEFTKQYLEFTQFIIDKFRELYDPRIYSFENKHQTADLYLDYQTNELKIYTGVKKNLYGTPKYNINQEWKTSGIVLNFESPDLVKDIITYYRLKYA